MVADDPTANLQPTMNPFDISLFGLVRPLFTPAIVFLATAATFAVAFTIAKFRRMYSQ